MQTSFDRACLNSFLKTGENGVSLSQIVFGVRSVLKD